MEHIKRMNVKTAEQNVAETDGHESRTAVPDRQLSKFFKALSDQTRREILRLLERHPHSVGEIVDNFQLSQPTISRHLSVLREADLVIDQRRGQHVIYRLNSSTLSESMLGFFGEFRQSRQELERSGVRRVAAMGQRQRPSL